MTAIFLITWWIGFLRLKVMVSCSNRKVVIPIILEHKIYYKFEGNAPDYINKNEDADKKKVTGKDWKKNQNQPVKLKFTYKEQKEYESIDDDIAALEEKIEQLDKDMTANATNSGKLIELSVQKAAAEAELEEKMDRWVYLNDLAERIEAQNS